MKKRELVQLLSGVGDDQEVFIDLHSDAYPFGSQVFIQGIEFSDPWKKPKAQQHEKLVGLIAHAGNRIYAESRGLRPLKMSREDLTKLIEAEDYARARASDSNAD